jgi:signal transduction histidine kinase
VELFQQVAELSNVELSLYCDHEVHLYGNEAQLQRCIANLLDNAVKYSRPGGTVAVRLASISRHQARLSVQDAGIGVPSADVAKLIDRFFRSDASRTLPGNGLGLALTKAIIERHKGSLAISSEVGVGTCAVVIVPTSGSL